MRLNQIISPLKESPYEDRAFRQRAIEAHAKIIESFVKMGGIEAMQMKNDMLVAWPRDFDHPEDIGLIIRPRQGNDIGGLSQKSSMNMIHLFIDFDKGLNDQNIVNIMKTNDYRKTIVHEFIHLFDSQRMKTMRPTSGLSDKDYYNDPSETNAYYQEAIAHFERQMQRIPASARERYMERYSGSFQEFLQLMYMMLDDSFLNERTVETDRALKRRLYRYWDEIVRTGNLG